jgi:signal transduction histidine kinase
MVRPALSDDDLREMGARWGSEIPARCLVSLPIAIDDGTAGLLVLAGPEPCDITDEALALWQAMANQVGVALANRRLLGRLEHALRVKSEFLNTMSHELRSPLHVVIGYADMLLETEDTAAVHDPVARMRASALELLRLVEESMTAARLEGGRVRIRTEEFSARDLVAELAENVRALPEAKRAAPVDWRIDPDVPRVWLDRLKVKEIVQNLVSNAIKFSPAGGVRVHVGREADSLKIAVEDRGPGIPRDAQARIFDMFERIEPADGNRTPGVGLGLYIVQQLVQLMGGTIELESWLDQGSRFTVRLPLALERAA